jgi:hypothetical protein
MMVYTYLEADFPGPFDYGRLVRQIITNSVILADAADFISVSPQMPETWIAFDVALGSSAKTELDTIVATIGSLGLDCESWTVAELLVAPGMQGEERWASNGRKLGEGPGAGTGLYVYYDTGLASWLTVFANVAVTA